MYSKTVIKHFQHPKNMGAMKNPDVQAEEGNVVCGDIMKIYLKIKDSKIKDISFETMGCVAAIATSSMLTEMAKGKTLAQAEKISYNDVAKELGQLPQVKMHCADLAVKTLQKAIKKYKKSNL
ncbi:iron-sulfur cluster assembly scaffold protein [Patescibacteria group bacterium]|nr:iron-sulfur cluster assembly scaffold protein [Patescibacteria group bacterium]MCG2695636.1 iron-sulfur cluster assembly scaffold protein [Candidatus Parcubacteria bacterium]MCG2809172.1 iron-sulfur cluster assembly scaffold protein [Candidatus Portnoybacteria bacterium]MBU2579812.1 iron-sulfur cluster assembly scaffold protein [Patescibacteria group bacterium]MBU4030832.1 iron-sulfur cluster assembly scaffold protein [Patescibacteria group bacterium]